MNLLVSSVFACVVTTACFGDTDWNRAGHGVWSRTGYTPTENNGFWHSSESHINYTCASAGSFGMSWAKPYCYQPLQDPQSGVIYIPITSNGSALLWIVGKDQQMFNITAHAPVEDFTSVLQLTPLGNIIVGARSNVGVRQDVLLYILGPSNASTAVVAVAMVTPNPLLLGISAPISDAVKKQMPVPFDYQIVWADFPSDGALGFNASGNSEFVVNGTQVVTTTLLSALIWGYNGDMVFNNHDNGYLGFEIPITNATEVAVNISSDGYESPWSIVFDSKANAYLTFSNGVSSVNYAKDGLNPTENWFTQVLVPGYAQTLMMSDDEQYLLYTNGRNSGPITLNKPGNNTYTCLNVSTGAVIWTRTDVTDWSMLCQQSYGPWTYRSPVILRNQNTAAVVCQQSPTSDYYVRYISLATGDLLAPSINATLFGGPANMFLDATNNVYLTRINGTRLELDRYPSPV